MAASPRNQLQSLILPLAVFAASCAYFSYQLDREPYFRDEGANIAHTYYYRLTTQGRIHHIDWLHQASYDHLQVARLLLGLSIDLHGYPIPNTIEGMEDWWDNQSAHKPDPATLRAARWPMLLIAATGCAMMYCLASSLVGPVTGLLAAFLLAASPLYFTHARRAMIDDTVQTLILAALLSSLWLARTSTRRPWPYRSWLVASLAAGLLFGLAAAAKLNGLIGLLVFLVATPIPVCLPLVFPNITRPTTASIAIWISGSVIATLAAFAVFFLIHPYFYAQPDLPTPQQTTTQTAFEIDGTLRSSEWIDKAIRPIASQSPLGRAQHMLQYRQQQMDNALRENRFPDAALASPAARLWAILNQGLGRWSATARLPLSHQLAWIPALLLIALGCSWGMREGWTLWKLGCIPIPWTLVLWPIVETALLLRELTLDWDRYYLGVVTWAALFMAIGVGGTARNLARRMILAPPPRSQSQADQQSDD